MIKVIKFYADWCGPCRVYAKTFDKVSEELKDKYDFVNINVETDTTGLAAEYKVTGIPTTVVIDGDKVKSESGRMDEKRLKAFIGSE